MASALSNRGVQLIVGGWAFFITENLVLSENRECLVHEFGESTYRNVYGSLSTLATGSIAVGYLRFGRGKGPVVWKGAASAPAQFAAFAFQSLGLVGFSQLAPPLQLPFTVGGKTGNAGHQHPPVGAEAAKTLKRTTTGLGLKAQCPINFDHSRKLEGKEGPCGAKRVTRHPVLFGMALVGLGAAVGSPLATHIAFGSLPMVMAVVGGWHTDHRGRRSGDLTPEDDARSSLMPFAALLEGTQSWCDLEEEISWSNAGLAVAAGALLAVRRRRNAIGILKPLLPK